MKEVKGTEVKGTSVLVHVPPVTCIFVVSVTETDFLGSNVVLYPQHRDSDNPGRRSIFNK